MAAAMAVFCDWTSTLAGVARGVARTLPGVGDTGGVDFFTDWTLAA